MNVKNNSNELLHIKAINDNRVTITSNEVAGVTGIRRDTVQSWLESKVVRFDARVMKALALYLGCSRVVYDVKTNELIFERSNTTNE